MKYSLLICLLFLGVVSCKEKPTGFKISFIKNHGPHDGLAREFRNTDSSGCEYWDLVCKQWHLCKDSLTHGHLMKYDTSLKTWYLFYTVNTHTIGYMLKYDTMRHKWDTLHEVPADSSSNFSSPDLVIKRQRVGGQTRSADGTLSPLWETDGINCWQNGKKVPCWIDRNDTSHSPEFNWNLNFDYRKGTHPYYDSTDHSWDRYFDSTRGVQAVGKHSHRYYDAVPPVYIWKEVDPWPKGHKDYIGGDTLGHGVRLFELGDTDRIETGVEEFEKPPIYANHAPVKPRRDIIKWNSHRNSTLAVFDPKSGYPYIGRFFADGTYYVSDSNLLIKELYKQAIKRDSQYRALQEKLDPLSQMENAVHCPYNKPTKESLRKERKRRKKYPPSHSATYYLQQSDDRGMLSTGESPKE